MSSSPGWTPHHHPASFPQPLNGGRYFTKEYSQYEELTSGFVRSYDDSDYRPRSSELKYQPNSSETNFGNRIRPTIWNGREHRFQNGSSSSQAPIPQLQETDILGDEGSSSEEEEAMRLQPQQQREYMPCCCRGHKIIPIYSENKETNNYVTPTLVESLYLMKCETAPNSPLINTELCFQNVKTDENDSSDEETRTPIRRRHEFTLPPEKQFLERGLLNPSNIGTKVHEFPESISATFKDGFVDGLDDKFSQMSPLLRSVSLRVRQQVQSTLSDPLRKRADKIGLEIRESKRKVEQLSAKLHVPAFLNNSVRSLISDEVGPSSSEEPESDDPEVLEQIERERIISMYEKGPENPKIDDWENPDWDVYKKTDRHGFIHKEGMSEADRTKYEKERIETEIRREKKWLLMLNQWDQKRPVKKLDERVWKGIPLKLRMRVWPRLLGIEDLKKQSRGDEIYAKLVDRARLISKDVKQIDLDINRTYRDNQTFRKRYDVKQKSLLNVLAAYSMYNTEIGYCQGMSQIAALFLMFLDEEEAFWCLHALMVSEKHSMHGFFVPGFPKLQRFEEFFKRILKKYKPKVYKHLEKEGIPYIYLTKWWFGCFLDRVPFSLALRLWDVFLFEGDTILIAMALNIMKMHERSIRKLTLETFMEFIQSKVAEDFGFPDDEVMKSLREVLTKLISDRLQRPPPPEAGSLPERPTKAFGPVLARSLKEIQDQVSEIRSRSSRANSVATGRTPQTRRRMARNHQSPGTPLNNDGSIMANSLNDSSVLDNKAIPFEIPSRGSIKEKQGPMTTSATSMRAVRPMGLAGREQMRAYSHGKLPQSQMTPSSDSLRYRTNLESSSRTDEFPGRQSTYDNVQPRSPADLEKYPNSPVRTVSIRDEYSGKMVYVVRGGENDESPSIDRLRLGSPSRLYTSPEAPGVTHSVNHVTYVVIGDNDDTDEWMSRV